jgi:predicted membrane GTPase involved in stress response
MLGVATFQFLSDFGVGPFPEAAQILSDLDRPLGRRQQVQGHRNPPAGDAWGIGQPEQLLQFDRQHRRFARLVDTKGEGIMVRSFLDYKPYAGEIHGRKNGVLVSMETGKSLGFSLWNLQDRGTLIIGPAVDVYVGMIVGINNRDNDLNVNPCKNKEMSNTRSKSSDDAIALVTPKSFSLEEALEFIEDDEYVEVTPAVIRLRKRILDPKDRFRENR